MVSTNIPGFTWYLHSCLQADLNEASALWCISTKSWCWSCYGEFHKYALLAAIYQSSWNFRYYFECNYFWWIQCEPAVEALHSSSYDVHAYEINSINNNPIIISRLSSFSTTYKHICKHKIGQQDKTVCPIELYVICCTYLWHTMLSIVTWYHTHRAHQ